MNGIALKIYRGKFPLSALAGKFCTNRRILLYLKVRLWKQNKIVVSVLLDGDRDGKTGLTELELKDTMKLTDKNSNHHLDQLLSKIEEGKIPLHLHLSRIFDLVIALNNKIDQLDKKLESLPHLADVKKQVEEIHTLHFAAKHLQKDISLVDKYLAEILTRKIKNRR